MLQDGFHDVPNGKLAIVVRELEMRAAPAARIPSFADGITLRAVTDPTLDWYRDIFRRVGADWLWFSRLGMDDDTLSGIIHDPDVVIFTLTKDGKDEALLELDFRTADTCELMFFGLTAPLIGTGAGRALIEHAIQSAWARPISRFHLHTCSLDSPQAFAFYQRAGFVATGQKFEVAEDPRIKGRAGFTRDHAPHVPIFD